LLRLGISAVSGWQVTRRWGDVRSNSPSEAADNFF